MFKKRASFGPKSTQRRDEETFPTNEIRRKMDLKCVGVV